MLRTAPDDRPFENALVRTRYLTKGSLPLQSREPSRGSVRGEHTYNHSLRYRCRAISVSGSRNLRLILGAGGRQCFFFSFDSEMSMRSSGVTLVQSRSSVHVTLALVARGSPTPIIDSARLRGVHISSAFLFSLFRLVVSFYPQCWVDPSGGARSSPARTKEKRTGRNSPPVVFFFFFLGRDSKFERLARGYHCLRTGPSDIHLESRPHSQQPVCSKLSQFPELPRPGPGRRVPIQSSPSALVSLACGYVWGKPRILKNEY